MRHGFASRGDHARTTLLYGGAALCGDRKRGLARIAMGRESVCRTPKRKTAAEFAPAAGVQHELTERHPLFVRRDSPSVFEMLPRLEFSRDHFFEGDDVFLAGLLNLSN
jgi:hypothetical protein